MLHNCSSCGIKIIRDDSFQGTLCTVCEDSLKYIREDMQRICNKYGLTTKQFAHILVTTIQENKNK